MPKPELTEHDALPAGTRLAEFEIEGVLGAGGFGIVYRALDHALERRVAIKEYMPAALAGRADGARVSLRASTHRETFDLGLRSFINEARLLARFDHPSLVKVYRFWEDNGTAYMVMPWYQGVTLREARMQMGAPVQEAWLKSLLEPMLGALELLHSQQVYHRDVAPDNVLLLGDAGGQGECHPVLLDFGAARHVIGDRTQSLTAILKPSFAPIEQYAETAGLRQGPWTDLYALAAVAHFCITGRAPQAATARTVDDELPRLAEMAEMLERDFHRSYSHGLLAAIDHALCVRPQDRPQSASAWRHELHLDVPRTMPQVRVLESAAAARLAPQPVAPDDAILRTVRVGGVATAGELQQQTQAYVTTIPAARRPQAANSAAKAAGDAAGHSAGDSGAAKPAALRAAVQATPGARVDAAPDPAPSAPPQRATAAWIWGLSGALAMALVMVVWQVWRFNHAVRPAVAPVTVATSPAAPAPGAARRVALRPAVPERAAGAESSRVRTAAKRSNADTDAEAANDDASSGATTPKQVCGKRVFIALAICMKRVCSQPEWTNHPQCVRMRQIEAANQPTQP